MTEDSSQLSQLATHLAPACARGNALPESLNACTKRLGEPRIRSSERRMLALCEDDRTDPMLGAIRTPWTGAWTAYTPANGMIAGTTVHAQFVSRDQGFPAPNNSTLSAGIEYGL